MTLTSKRLKNRQRDPVDPTQANVLVVEDNVPNFVLIARMLAYMGVPRCEWKTSGWQVVEFALPESALRQGLNQLVLHFGHAIAPSDALPDSSDHRPLAAAVDWIEVGGR